MRDKLHCVSNYFSFHHIYITLQTFTDFFIRDFLVYFTLPYCCLTFTAAGNYYSLVMIITTHSSGFERCNKASFVFSLNVQWAINSDVSIMYGMEADQLYPRKKIYRRGDAGYKGNEINTDIALSVTSCVGSWSGHL
jgi:hypothetical protein